jgi:hypothetical protein
MKYSDFIIGQEFLCGGKRWRCTDVGTRVIVAICVSEITITSEYAAMTQTVSKEEAETQGWFNGPPYAVEEIVFDQNDMEGCEAVDATTQLTRPGDR